MVTKSNIDQYESNGYTYIDNFLPEKVASDLEKIYAENTKWDLIDQVRETHYQHVMKTESPYLVVKVLQTSGDSNLFLEQGDLIVIERRMLTEIEIKGEKNYLVLENYIYGRIDDETY